MAAPMKKIVFGNFLTVCKECRLSRLVGKRSIYLQSRRLHTNDTSEDVTADTVLEEDFDDDSSSEDPPHPHQPLYPGHIQTNIFQKSLLAVGSAAMAITNPWRDDMIATMGETTGQLALRYMHQKMKGDEEGRQILEDKPLINTQTIDLEYLKQLPEETFGKQYWYFLDKNGFSPDARLPVQFVDDFELAYVMLRYRQIHDLVHTLCGMKPNMLGEVAVKWIEGLQTGLPMCVLGGAFGPVRFGPKWRQKYIQLYLPWAIRNGLKAKPLMCVYFEKHWEVPIDELRRTLNIDPPPE